MLYAVGIILIFLGLLFWNYGTYASTVVSWCKPLDVKANKKIHKPKLSVGEAISCYVPIYQACVVWKALHGSFDWTLPVGIASGLCIVIRLVCAFLIPNCDMILLFVTVWVMWLGLLLYFILYGVVTFSCARMYEFRTFYSIIVFFFPQIFCQKMSTNIADKMRKMHKEETFDEHHGDTVIKSRHS